MVSGEREQENPCAASAKHGAKDLKLSPAPGVKSLLNERMNRRRHRRFRSEPAQHTGQQGGGGGFDRARTE